MEDKKDAIRHFEEPVEKAKKLIGLKYSAYKDYIAARILFLNSQLHQAAFFANTCIEKELKACLYSLGVDCRVQHDSFKLLNLLNNHNPETYNKLKPDFIKMLTKIYKSRYHEDLNPGYNFVIIKNKFLAELDFTYSILEPKVRYKTKREPDIAKTIYELDVLNKMPRVLLNNYLYNNISKEKFLKMPDTVFEFRIIFNHEVVEALYSIPENTDWDRFIYEGLVSPPENNQSFQISNQHPGINDIAVTRNGILHSMKID